MIHEEKTTELELPSKKTADTQATIASAIVIPDSVPVVIQSSKTLQSGPKSQNEFDWNSPWVLRLVAVLAILVLSMIIL